MIFFKDNDELVRLAFDNILKIVTIRTNLKVDVGWAELNRPTYENFCCTAQLAVVT